MKTHSYKPIEIEQAFRNRNTTGVKRWDLEDASEGTEPRYTMGSMVQLKTLTEIVQHPMVEDCIVGRHEITLVIYSENDITLDIPLDGWPLEPIALDDRISKGTYTGRNGEHYYYFTSLPVSNTGIWVEQWMLQETDPTLLAFEKFKRSLNDIL